MIRYSKVAFVLASLISSPWVWGCGKDPAFREAAAARNIGQAQGTVLPFLPRQDMIATDLWGRTALHSATLTRDLAVIQSIIHDGANVNATDFHHQTALHLGAESGDLAKV